MRVLLSALFLTQAFSVSAEEVSGTSPPLEMQISTSKAAELEKAFWKCDHAGTKGMIDMNQGALCSAITDELQREKFGGDFEKLLAWWRLNKIAQHQQLDRASTAVIDSEQTSGTI